MLARLAQVARHLSRPSFMATPTPLAGLAAADRHRRQIHTAGIIIIGDEVLGGKTVDSNSAYVAKWAFALGIALKRIVVISDDEAEIIESARQFSDAYDLVFTSGGIGPTHDDITYESIAKAYSLPLKLHDEAFERMKKLSVPHKAQRDFSWDKPSPALDARKRMVLLPTDGARPLAEQAVFPCDDLWVPVSIVNGNIYILPGVPRLFEKLLDALRPTILPRLPDEGARSIHRILISTPLPESEVAGFLTELSKKTEPRGVKVGSYPRWGKSHNTVTLVGRDKEWMESLVDEVAAGVQGMRVKVEGEDDGSSDKESDKDK